jgi:hypothetical protein
MLIKRRLYWLKVTSNGVCYLKSPSATKLVGFFCVITSSLIGHKQLQNAKCAYNKGM